MPEAAPELAVTTGEDLPAPGVVPAELAPELAVVTAFPVGDEPDSDNDTPLVENDVARCDCAAITIDTDRNSVTASATTHLRIARMRRRRAATRAAAEDGLELEQVIVTSWEANRGCSEDRSRR